MARSKSLLDRIIEFPILVILLGILIGAPLMLGAVKVEAFSLLCGAAGVMLVIHGVILAIRPTKRQLWLPPIFAVLAFCLYALWSYLNADIEYAARIEWLRVLSYSAIFICVVQQLHRQSWIYALVMAIIIVGSGLAIMAIIQYVTESKMVWDQPLPKQYWGRGSGSYICPNHLAGLLEMVIPITFTLGLISRLNTPMKIALIYLGLVMIAGVIVTFSRGAWISVAISLMLLAFFIIRRPHLRWATIAVVSVLCIGIYTFAKNSDDVEERIDEVTLESGKVENIRFIIWKPAMTIWKDHLWTGAGPGHFDYLFPQHRPETFQYRAGRVHNDYLNTLTDYGIIGFLLACTPVLLLGWKFKTIWKSNKRDQSVLGEKNSNKEPVFIGCCLGVVALLIHATVDFNLHIPANAAIFATILAIAISYWRHSTRKFWISPTWWMTALQIPIFVGLGFYLVWQAYILNTSEAHQKLALTNPDSNERLELLTKSISIDPNNYQTATLIGENYRKQSWLGESNYEELAKKAIEWHKKATELNPWHYYAHLRAGMSYDWIYQFEEGKSEFDKALKIDPNGYFTQSHIGWHYLNINDLQNALKHLERSKKLKHFDNEFTDTYLEIVRGRLEGN